MSTSKSHTTIENTSLNLVTIEELSEDLKVSRQTINNWVRKGYLRIAKIGHRGYFKAEDIHEIINKQLSTNN
jgi:excisionase family DNA binding protein